MQKKILVVLAVMLLTLGFAVPITAAPLPFVHGGTPGGSGGIVHVNIPDLIIPIPLDASNYTTADVDVPIRIQLDIRDTTNGLSRLHLLLQFSDALEFVSFDPGPYNPVNPAELISNPQANNAHLLQWWSMPTGIPDVGYFYITVRIPAGTSADDDLYVFLYESNAGYLSNAGRGNRPTEVIVRTGTSTIVEPQEEAHTVTFDLQGGTGDFPPIVNIPDNTTITPPATEPTLANHVFDTWVTSSGTEFDFSTPITGSKTLYARWTPEWTVTFYVNGGTLVSGDLIQTVIDGDSATPPVVERAGHSFIGWTPPAGYIGVTDHIALEAQWEELFVSYTFNCVATGLSQMGSVAYGGTPTAPTMVSPRFVGGYVDEYVYLYTDYILGPVYGYVPVYDPFLYEYVFIGWSPAVVAIFEDTIFTASWVRVDDVYVTYVFYCPYELGVISSGSVPYGVPPTEPSPPERIGFNFTGWAPAVDTGYMLRIYAQWEEIFVNYTFNWDVAGEENVTGSVRYNTAPTPPTGVTRAGYTFGGWSPAVDPITVDTIFTAQWNPIMVNYTFNWNVASEPNVSGQVQHGTAPTAPTGVTRPGYIFGGWSPIVGPITNPTTFTAIWTSETQPEVVVTFDLMGGTGNFPPQVIPVGGTATQPTTVPVLAGYDFAGWFTINGTRFK